MKILCIFHLFIQPYGMERQFDFTFNITTMSLHIFNFWSYGNEQFNHVPVPH